jgi:hypothetical protein
VGPSHSITSARSIATTVALGARGIRSESFSLADVRMTGDVPSDEVILYFSPAGLVVVAPLPGGLHHIVARADRAPKAHT